VIKTAKCKQIGTYVLPYKILIHCGLTNCQNANEAKDGSGIWPMSNFLTTVTGTHKRKICRKIKIIAFIGSY
jgi:hypothetical protein